MQVIRKHTVAIACAAALCVNACGGKKSPSDSEGLDGTAIDIPLAHNALAYDPTRNVYYASVRGSAGATGNRIATISAAGAVSYSAPVGSEPSALAISADGSLLYVGLDGTGDVVELTLPSMTEQARTRLPSDFAFGQLHAAKIAVSPADSTVIAVVMERTGGTPFAGLVLLRNMVIQPRAPSFPSTTLIAFDATGTSLYGLGTQTSDFALVRNEVVADGLISNSLTRADIDYTSRALSVVGDRVVAGSAIYDAPAGTAAGVIATPSDCVLRRSGDLLVCFDDLPGAAQAFLLLADPGTFVIQAALVHSNPEPKSPRDLVEGPAGQVAISYPGLKIRLFASAGLLAPPLLPAPSWPVSMSAGADGQTLDIGIVHNSLAYDNGRNVYYASIPGAVPIVGNSIATINPANGQISYSAPVGSEPDRLAIAADASVLYVGLDGSGEVLRLALPSMTPQGRARLVASPGGISGAESISVSPVDATVVAVSMASMPRFTEFFPHHTGVALLRDMVMQPKTLPGGYDGNNLVAFDSAGAKLYGLTIEPIAFGIHRIGVLADGLAEELRVDGAASASTRAFAFANGRAIAGATQFDPATLQATGTIADASDCWPARTGNALLCFSTQPARVLVASSPFPGPFVYAAAEPDRPQLLVQGPSGQVGISYFPESALPFVRLFSSPHLP